MKDIQKLLESAVLNEETTAALMEAWDNQLLEAKEEIAAELREDFSNRFEHDLKMISEAADRMVTEAIVKEFDELAEDKKAAKEARKKLEEQTVNFAKNSSKIIQKMLENEIKEFRTERKQVKESVLKMNNFVVKKLNEEISDFAKDKIALTEERILFEKSKKKKLAEAKMQFVSAAAKASEKMIRESLEAEISQLRTDLNESRKKMFGAKLFEAFQTEFMSSYFNEKSHIGKMNKTLQEMKSQLTEAKSKIAAKENELTEAKRKIRVVESIRERNDQLNKLLSPLNKEQRAIMGKLLEHVETKNLQDNYKKMLPMVIKGDAPIKQKLTENTTISSTREYDGNRGTTDTSKAALDIDLLDLKRLSGIVK